MAAPRSRLTRGTALVVLTALAACGPADAPEAEGDAPVAATDGTSANRIAALLASDRPVFGVFSGDHTPEQGAAMAGNRDTDFVFYSLESGPFDVDALRAYIQAMDSAAAARGVEPRPVVLRIPPIDDAEESRERIRRGLEAGVDGIVVPHVARADQAEALMDAMGPGVWPGDPSGGQVTILLVEDREGIDNVDDIADTPGISVVIPGPGDLRRAYDGDMDAVEDAIQTTLTACNEAGVACGITAGADDIGQRLDQGFRMIIVYDEAALAEGRRHAGRTAGD